MQQIADWLEKLGMSEYAQGFAENRIDFSVLRDLTDQDLEKLGVLLGDQCALGYEGGLRKATGMRPQRSFGVCVNASAPIPGPLAFPAPSGRSQDAARHAGDRIRRPYRQA